tara:strand:+ start:62 stop:328 length:267 start_codon:yes stop_codon:yes gene_type:complete
MGALNQFGWRRISIWVTLGRGMMLRQRLGFILMLLFLPINGPMWRMMGELIGYSIPLSEFYFFVASILLFALGAIMAMSPKWQIFQNR